MTMRVRAIRRVLTVALAGGLVALAAGRAGAQAGGAGAGGAGTGGAGVGAGSGPAIGGTGTGAFGGATGVQFGAGNAFAPGMGPAGFPTTGFNPFSSGFATMGPGGNLPGVMSPGFNTTGATSFGMNGFNPLLSNGFGNNTNGFQPNFGSNFFGTNPLLNNPASFNGFNNNNAGGATVMRSPQDTANLGLNPLTTNPISAAPTANDLGRNPLVGNPISAVPPGQTPNFNNNPLFGNPAGEAAFSPNAVGFGTGQVVGPNGLPLNDIGVSPGFLASPLFNNGLAGAAGSSGGGFFLSAYPGPGTSYGLTPYDQSLLAANAEGLTGARYNIGTGLPVQGYAAANFRGPIAAATAYRNYKTSTGMRPFYNVSTGASRFAGRGGHRAAARPAGLLPRDRVIDQSGRVLWPASAPNKPDEVARARRGVDEAVTALFTQYQSNGRSSVGDTVEARNALAGYSRLAMERTSAEQAPELALFLQSLDAALVDLGGAAQRVGSMDTRPENAPKSAGDVLKDEVKADSPTRGRPDPAGTPTRGTTGRTDRGAGTNR